VFFLFVVFVVVFFFVIVAFLVNAVILVLIVVVDAVAVIAAVAIFVVVVAVIVIVIVVVVTTVVVVAIAVDVSLAFIVVVVFVVVAAVATSLPIPVFRNHVVGPQKLVPFRMPEYCFCLFFRRKFFTGTWFWRGLENSCFQLLSQDFSQEFLWDRNSCICIGFLPIPPDSCSHQKMSGLDQRLKEALC
jgi:hypothetical protein